MHKTPCRNIVLARGLFFQQGHRTLLYHYLDGHRKIALYILRCYMQPILIDLPCRDFLISKQRYVLNNAVEIGLICVFCLGEGADCNMSVLRIAQTDSIDTTLSRGMRSIILTMTAAEKK